MSDKEASDPTERPQMSYKMQLARANAIEAVRREQAQPSRVREARRRALIRWLER